MVSRAWVLVKLGSAEESRVLDAMFWLFERLGGLESAMLPSGLGIQSPLTRYPYT